MNKLLTPNKTYLTKTYIKLLLFFALFQFTNCKIDNVKYEISNSGIKIDEKMYGRFIPKDSILLTTVKIIDLNNQPEYKPSIRLKGIGQPEIKELKIEKYLSGWFLLENGDKALIFMSNHNKVIYFETTYSYPVLIGSTNPDQFMKRLNNAWRIE